MTHPLLDVMDLNFRPLTHFELANKIITIADAIAVHPGFQEPFPAAVPTPKELKDLATQYHALVNAAQSGDRNKIAERDALRPKTELNAALTVQWAVIRSLRENNPGLIANIGVEQKKRVTTRNLHPGLVSAPVNIAARHGQVSGTIALYVGKVQGAVTYEVQICQGDPTQEQSWSDAAKSAHCRNIEIKGLEPGKMYNFRVRCFGSSGHGPWSHVVSLMAL